MLAPLREGLAASIRTAFSTAGCRVERRDTDPVLRERQGRAEGVRGDRDDRDDRALADGEERRGQEPGQQDGPEVE